MKKKSQKRKKVDLFDSFNNINDVFMDEEKPRYTNDDLYLLIPRFEHHPELRRLFPEFFGDKGGEFIIVD